MQKVTHIPNRIDRDPSVLMGVTAPEFNTIAWLAFPSFVIGTILFWIVFGSLIAAAFTGLALAMYVSFSALLYVARIKRGKPPHWLPHTTSILLDKAGLKAAPFIYKTTHYHAIRD